MSGHLPAWAYAVALAGLPYMTWDRLARVLAGGGQATGAGGPRSCRAARPGRRRTPCLLYTSDAADE